MWAIAFGHAKVVDVSTAKNATQKMGNAQTATDMSTK